MYAGKGYAMFFFRAFCRNAAVQWSSSFQISAKEIPRRNDQLEGKR